MKQAVQTQDGKKKPRLSRKHRNDFILAAVMIFVAAAGFFWHQITQEEGSYVAVIQDGEEIRRFSLKEEQVYRIESENGESNLLCIQGGKAYMKEADCPDQICVNHRPIVSVGETIVCLPHKLVIKVISGAETPEIDMGI